MFRSLENTPTKIQFCVCICCCHLSCNKCQQKVICCFPFCLVALNARWRSLWVTAGEDSGRKKPRAAKKRHERKKRKKKKKSDRMIMLARCRSWYIVGTKWGYVKLKTALVGQLHCSYQKSSMLVFFNQKHAFYVANLQNLILFGVNRILVKSELIIKDYQVVSLATEFSRSFRPLLISVDRWLQ